MITNDIYFKVDSNIVNNGFWQIDIQEKKELIDQALKKYIISKLNDLGVNNVLTDSKKDTSVDDLLGLLAINIPQPKHSETLNHFTHYILNVAGNLQNFSIIWWQEDDEELICNPRIEINERGQWEKLVTHEKTGYVQTFSFVYDIFQNKFMVNENDNKQDISVRDKMKSLGKSKFYN